MGLYSKFAVAAADILVVIPTLAVEPGETVGLIDLIESMVSIAGTGYA